MKNRKPAILNLTRLRRSFLRVAFRISPGALLSGALSFLGAYFVLRLWEADLDVPFEYEGDARSIGMFVRRLQDTPNYLTNPYLGWPDGQQFAEIPLGADNLTLAVLWAIGRFTSNFGTMMNVYYVATFVLIPVFTYAAMRLLALSVLTSVFVAILYTFLPYHFRGEAHLLLAGYYLVPLSLVVILWQMTHDTCLLRALGTADKGQRRRLWLTVGTCVLLGMTGAYYAVFFVLLLLPSSALVALATRSARTLKSALLCAGLTVTSLLLNVLPTIVFWAQNGRGTGFVRPFGETEVYGLKLSGLLLPAQGHRIDSFAELTAKSLTAPYPSEFGQPVGAIAAAGLVFALIAALTALVIRGTTRSALRERLDQLSLLAIVAILIGTIGGLSTLISLAGFNFVRVYSRLSVVLGLIGLIVVGLGLDWLARRDRLRRHPVIMVVIVVTLMGVGVFDQTTAGNAPNYAYQKARYANDSAFVSSVERQLPTGGKVFQLPILPFPEAPAPGVMNDYDHLRGYLQSKTLYYSYGAIKGRNDWQLRLTQVPPAVLVRVVQAVGYDAIWIDRNGYTDRGASLEGDLRKLLGKPLIESPDASLALYRVGPMRLGSTPPLTRDLALSPMAINPAGPVGGPERDGEEIVHTAFGPVVSLDIRNDLKVQRAATARFGVRSVARQGGQITLTLGKTSRTFRATPETTSCEVRFVSPSGSSSLGITFEGPGGSFDPLTSVPRYGGVPFVQLVDFAVWDAERPASSRTPAISCDD